MAISRLTGQDAVAAVTAQTATANYPSTPTQGNLLIAVGFAAVVVFQQSMSNSGWSIASASIDANGTMNMLIWYKIAGSSEPTAITTTQGTGVNAVMRLSIYEYTTAVNSLKVGSVIVADASNLGNTPASSDTAVNNALSNSITPTNANCLLFCAICWNGTTVAASASWNSSFNVLSPNTRMTTADRIVSATGTYQPTCSWTTLRGYNHILVAFAEIRRGAFLQMF